MISLAELNPSNHTPTPLQQANLEKLHKAMQAIRAAYGKPMIITSGLRSMEEHRAIYDGINAKRKSQGIRPTTVPLKSAHLEGLACDVWDRNKSLYTWCKANVSLLEKHGLYLEDGTRTPNWVHFQIIPPKSGNRFFLP